MEIETRPDAAGTLTNMQTMQQEVRMPIGEIELQKFTKILEEYKAGKAKTEQRILASENWWKLRNNLEEQKTNKAAGAEGFKSVSGWLHNVIVSKHADAMKAFPEPNLLAREESDKGEARMLSAIVPCVLEQNQFEQTYSDANWQKLKTGTGLYKVVWDNSKLNGLGDIHIERVNLLNVYWEPGISKIQRSRYFFHTELWDKDVLEEKYPQLQGKLNGQGFFSTKFLYDDSVKTENKHTVIEVYYHKYINNVKTLQYVKYVGNQVLFASENDPEMAMRGLYDHGKYPYFFDALFPIEGSPCGYGYVDLCANPQTEIDTLKTAMIKNAQVGAVPRYFSRIDGNVNEEEFLDTTKPVVHVSGNVDEASLRKIDHCSLDGMYINLLDRSIDELRETSGNTEAATGSTPGSVTAASGIAALQEAAGKTSADATQASYRVFAEIVDTCVELIRQFYDLPRKFRILGQYGTEQYVTYTNEGIRPQDQGAPLGVHLGYRTPVFDIKISAQKKNVYTKVAQNELALQFFQLGFFNPQMAEQALMCLEMMDFDDRDSIMQKISQNAILHQKLAQYMQMAMQMAQMTGNAMLAQQVANDMAMVSGQPVHMNGAAPHLIQADNIGGVQREEHSIVANARQQSNEASQPDSDAPVKTDRR